MDLEFSVNNQIIVKLDKKRPANLSQEYLRLCFQFTDDWDGLGKFALFKVGNDTIRVALSDDKVVVPGDVLKSHRILFSLYGVDDGNLRITTNIVKINLLKSGFTHNVKNDDSELDDPSTVEEIYIELNKKVYTDTLDIALQTKADTVHNHTVSQITDFPIIPSKTSDLTNDCGYINDLRDYYTKEEVMNIIDGLNNRLILHSTRNPVLIDENSTITGLIIQNGIPQSGVTLNIYEEYDYNRLIIGATKQIVLLDETVEITATLIDTDGSRIEGETVNIYMED